MTFRAMCVTRAIWLPPYADPVFLRLDRNPLYTKSWRLLVLDHEVFSSRRFSGLPRGVDANRVVSRWQWLA